MESIEKYPQVSAGMLGISLDTGKANMEMLVWHRAKEEHLQIWVEWIYPSGGWGGCLAGRPNGGKRVGETEQPLERHLRRESGFSRYCSLP